MDLPKRKPTRLKGYDYSAPGAYFVTICTHNKQCILSKIVVPCNILNFTFSIRDTSALI